MHHSFFPEISPIAQNNNVSNSMVLFGHQTISITNIVCELCTSTPVRLSDDIYLNVCELYNYN